MRALLRVAGFIYKFSRTVIFLSLFALFVASHTIAAVSAAVGAVIETVSGVKSLADTRFDALKSDRAKLADFDRKISDLEARNRKLSLDADDLRAKNAALDRDVKILKRKVAPDVHWKGKKVPLTDAVADMTSTVKKRTAKAAAANVRSIFGKAVPVYGIAVTVAFTAYDLKSSCDTMKDMKELATQLDPDFDADGETAVVCGMKVPTREEIVQKLKESPEIAWEMAQSAYDGAIDMIPSWDTVKNLPGSVWNGLVDASASAGGWIADGSVAAWDWTAESVEAGGKAVVEWWNPKE